MLSTIKRAVIAGVAGLALLAVRAGTLSAQVTPRPGLTPQQYYFNLAALGALANAGPAAFVSPFAAAAPAATLYANQLGAATMTSNPYAASPYTDPYSTMYSNPYYYPTYFDPYGGYLRGAADVINAQGRFMQSQAQSYLTWEQVRQARVTSRRAIFDEWLYEREKTPTPEDERERFLKEQLRHSRNNPSVTEIWSGKVLNDLLAELRKNINKAENTTAIPLPLDEDDLKRINITSTKGGNNIGLLKNQGRLTWPIALTGEEFGTMRQRVNSLTQSAVQQAMTNGQVDAGTLQQLGKDVNTLQDQLRRRGGDLSFSLYNDAKNFLNNLEDANKALQQPDVGSFFNGKYQLRGKTVGDLVRFMADQGLQFAPAVPGDESAYTALYQALAQYDVAMHTSTNNK